MSQQQLQPPNNWLKRPPVSHVQNFHAKGSPANSSQVGHIYQSDYILQPRHLPSIILWPQRRPHTEKFNWDILNTNRHAYLQLVDHPHVQQESDGVSPKFTSQGKPRPSSVKNPSFLLKLWWISIVLLNVSMLFSGMLLAYTFGSQAYTQKTLETNFFIFLVIFEIGSRLMHVYNIYDLTKQKGFSAWQAIGIMLGKKEWYFLTGGHHLREDHINFMSYADYLICFIYFIYVLFLLVDENRKLHARQSAAREHIERAVYLIYTLCGLYIMNFLSMLVWIMKKAFHNAKTRAVKETTIEYY